eukprot:IDg20918t1
MEPGRRFEAEDTFIASLVFQTLSEFGLVEDLTECSAIETSASYSSIVNTEVFRNQE